MRYTERRIGVDDLVFIDYSPHGYFLPWFIVSGFDILLV